MGGGGVVGVFGGREDGVGVLGEGGEGGLGLKVGEREGRCVG